MKIVGPLKSVGAGVNCTVLAHSGAKDDAEDEGENEEKDEKEKTAQRSQFGTTMILTLEHLRR